MFRQGSTGPYTRCGRKQRRMTPVLCLTKMADASSAAVRSLSPMLPTPWSSLGTRSSSDTMATSRTAIASDARIRSSILIGRHTMRRMTILTPHRQWAPQPGPEAEVALKRQSRGDENEKMCFVQETQVRERTDRQIMQPLRPHTERCHGRPAGGIRAARGVR